MRKNKRPLRYIATGEGCLLLLSKGVIMGFLKKIFGTNKDNQEKILSFNTLPNAHKVFVENNANPPFVYLKDEYPLKMDKFSTIADLLNSAAMGTAKQFEEESSYRANDYLVHYFFDLYLSLNSGLFQQESDIASAIIDWIHFKYYGQPSQNIISSQIQLWAEKERCFLNSPSRWYELKITVIQWAQ